MTPTQLRVRVVRDVEEIASFDVHDFRVLSVEVKHRTVTTKQGGYSSSQMSKSAMIELGFHESFPRYRIHVDDMVYLEQAPLEPWDHLLELVVSKKHPIIEKLNQSQSWESDWEVRHLGESGMGGHDEFVCFTASRHSEAQTNFEASLAADGESFEECPVVFPDCLTAIGRRIWAEEISGHSNWP